MSIPIILNDKTHVTKKLCYTVPTTQSDLTDIQSNSPLRQDDNNVQQETDNGEFYYIMCAGMCAYVCACVCACACVCVCSESMH